MISLVEQNRSQLVELCRRFHVRALELFGSAAGDRYDPARSDLDFLVVFEEATPAEYASRYFGLLAALEDLFHSHIHLVDLEAIRNPYFSQVIQSSRTPLYAASCAIVSFRHVLVHGYDSVRDDVVWGVIETDLGQLQSELATLLS